MSKVRSKGLIYDHNGAIRWLVTIWNMTAASERTIDFRIHVDDASHPKV